jgi:hypothetical protein
MRFTFRPDDIQAIVDLELDGLPTAAEVDHGIVPG